MIRRPTTRAPAALAAILLASGCAYDFVERHPCFDVEVTEDCADGFCRIDPGCFVMGSPPDEPCRELPSDAGGTGKETAHEVRLTHAFEISTTEITQGMFLDFDASHEFAHHSTDAGCGQNCFCGSGDCNQAPADEINWHEAAAYCNALSSAIELEPCYSCTGKGPSTRCTAAEGFDQQRIHDCPGYRLPTEAEWEYAYRAGTTTAYYGGPNLADKCDNPGEPDPVLVLISTYADGDHVHPVASKVHNAWGLYDMAGNVIEWCHDRFLIDLGSEPIADPWGTDSGKYRVVRGGTHSDYQYTHSQRAARRARRVADHRHFRQGFRCARTLSLD